MSLRERFKAARQAQCMSQANLAGATGVKRGRIAQIESGRNPMTLDDAAWIAAALGLSQRRALRERMQEMVDEAHQGAFVVTVRSKA